MRGVVFDLSLARYALAKGLGRWVPALYTGRASCLSLRELPEPRPPDDRWAVLAPTHAGLCGSDLATIFLETPPSLEPFSSFPCVLGHEILARVVQPPRGSELKEGDRVVVDPLLPCALRGVRPVCPACHEGKPNRCRSFARGHLAPGMMLGFHRDLPGGFGDRMVAHGSQLHRVPDGIPDNRAALAEPMAVGLHAALVHRPRAGDLALVIGGGPIAMALIWALRVLEARPATLALLTLLDYQAHLGTALGATSAHVARTLEEVLAETCRVTGATSHQPIVGPPTLVGGFDVVYDCVGSRDTIEQAMRVTRAGGTVVVVGAPGTVGAMDLSFLWSKELKIKGTVAYGNEDIPGKGKQKTFDLALEAMTDATLGAPLDRLVTHTLPLERYQEAVAINVSRARYRSVKTLLTTGTTG